MNSANAYHVPLHFKIIRPITKAVFRGIFGMLARVKIIGKQNIPYGKPYVVAMNHVSIFDPPFVGAFWPEQLEIIGAIDVFSKPGQGQLLKLYGVIPVHRGDYDRTLLTKIISTTEDFWQRAKRGKKPPLEMRIGKPITLPPITAKGTEKHTARQKNADLVMSYLAGLLPEEYRGVYAGSAIIPSS